MEATDKGLVFCGKGNKMGWTSTQEVNCAARLKTWDPCSHLLVEENHLV